ncbi:MAG: hypothetical protein WC717_04445 [Candidatus Micrarchaeia archaeon]|jgi:hypothetical protein
MAKTIRQTALNGEQAKQVPIGETITIKVGRKTLTLRKIDSREKKIFEEKHMESRAELRKGWLNEKGEPVQRLVSKALVEAVKTADLMLFKAVINDKAEINAPVSASKTLKGGVHLRTVYDLVSDRITEVRKELRGQVPLGKKKSLAGNRQLRSDLEVLEAMRSMVMVRDGRPRLEPIREKLEL